MCRSTMNARCCGSKILLALVCIGAINWGLVGAFDLDLVAALFGSVSWLQDLIYILVGVAGIALLLGGCRCRRCNTTSGCGDCKSGCCSPKEKKQDGCCGGGCCEDDSPEDTTDTK